MKATLILSGVIILCTLAICFHIRDLRREMSITTAAIENAVKASTSQVIYKMENPPVQPRVIRNSSKSGD